MTIRDVLEFILFIILMILFFFNLIGIIRGGSTGLGYDGTITYCSKNRMIDNNRITGLGYKLTCNQKEYGKRNRNNIK